MYVRMIFFLHFSESEIMFCPFEGCGYSTKFKHTMKNHIAGMHTHKVGRIPQKSLW